MDLTIRRAVAGDHPRLLALWRAAVGATHDFLTAADVDAIEVDVAGALPAFVDLRVAVISTTVAPGVVQDSARDLVVGFVAQDDGEIHALFVDPAVHGRGVGTALLEHVATAYDVVRVDVNEDNPSARAFYATRGFEVAGRSERDGEGRPFPLLHLRREARRPGR